MATGGEGGGGGGVAPFVAKTYRMVDDAATDAVVAWGRDNNSFVVADPFAFSRTLLPAHFKHSNFSSFVRQLNTYGFRKVDPDRWEFAHVARTCCPGSCAGAAAAEAERGGGGKEDDAAAAAASAGAGDADADEDAAVAAEVVRLRREQRAIEDQVAAMWRRVQETERRPKQMLAFLLKVAGDPHVLRRLVSGGDGAGFASDAHERAVPAVKRPRLLHDAEDGGCGSGGDGAVVDFFGLYGGAAQDDAGFAVADYLQPPPYVFPVNSGY
ncbi:hypothetical protein U9M48_025099 [Paspalum notatum var. saurae]|uniref:HSF-type DNA-binding domain-containing protein n=1 Tax=Paspalum notatum var. saurae TaxID=547442 RepID=A0AAQ3TPV7_PASNO